MNNTNIDQAVIDRITNILTAFINDKYQSTNEFCTKQNIKRDSLKIYANTIKDLYPEIFEQYQIRIAELKQIEKLNQDIIKSQYNKDKYIYYCNMLKEYILGNFKTPNEYSQSKKKCRSELSDCIRYITTINPQIIDIYNEYNKREYLVENDELAKFSKILIDWLMNGIEVNGKKRKFDISDYFMATDIDIFELDLYIKNQNKLNINEKRAFGELTKRIENLEKITLPEQFKKSTMATIIKNGKGEIKVNNMEKEKIFEFIEANQLPFYTFNDIMNKYLNKEISLKEQYDKKVPSDFNKNVLLEHKKLIVKINVLLATDEYILNIDSEIKAKEDEKNNILRNTGITR